MNDQANPSAAGTGTTGLLFTLDVVGLLSNAFFNQVYLGIADAAATAGRHVLGLFGACERPDRIGPAVLDSPAFAALDSLVTIELFDDNLIGELARRRPVVVVDALMPQPNVSSIRFDHPASIQMAFDHLLALGHRRIGFVGPAAGADPAVAERRGSFEQNLARLDEPAKDRLLFLASSTTHLGDLVKQWLGQPPALRPTALIVIDNTFWAFLFGLISAGLRIPEDLSLVNVGTVQTWADHANHAMRMHHRQRPRPPIIEPLPRHFNNEPASLAVLRPTTVSLSAVGMGRWAIEELTRRLDKPGSDPRHKVLGPELVEGNTTAPVSGPG